MDLATSKFMIQGYFFLILLTLAPYIGFSQTSTDNEPKKSFIFNHSHLEKQSILTVPDTRTLTKESVKELTAPAKDFLNWSLSAEGTDNNYSGGVIAGGGDILLRQSGPSILLDFWYFDKNFRDQAASPSENILFPRNGSAHDLFYGVPVEVERSLPDTLNLLKERISLWKEDSPLLISMLEKALKKPNFRVTAIPFHCAGRGSPDPNSHHTYPDYTQHANSVAAACFFAHRGIYLHDLRFNSLGKLSRAGIIAHELLRKIQSDFDIGFADTRLLTAVNLLMRDTPVKGQGKLDDLIFNDQWRPLILNQDDLDFDAGVFCTAPLENEFKYVVDKNKIAIQLEALRRTIAASTTLPDNPSVFLNRFEVCKALDQRKVMPAERCLKKDVSEWSSEEIKGAYDTAVTGVRILKAQDQTSLAGSAPSWILNSPHLHRAILNKKILLGLHQKLSDAVNAGACDQTYMLGGQDGSHLWVHGERDWLRLRLLLTTVFNRLHRVNNHWDTSWSRNSLRWPQFDLELESRFGPLWQEYENVWQADRRHYLDVVTENRLRSIHAAVELALSNKIKF